LIAVRRARPEEYDRVGALTIDAYRALPVDHLWGGYEERILDTEGRARGAEVLVAATGDGAIVGSVTYVADESADWGEWIEPGEAQFRLLAVEPAARGLGAGGALVAACVERATATDQTIVIHTTPWMETAQRIYQRFGFVRRPERDVPYEGWLEDGVADLPNEWVGRPFLAYSWDPPGTDRDEARAPR
jgi:ribosomal protein S18 acetylase RimI-like enzyme